MKYLAKEKRIKPEEVRKAILDILSKNAILTSGIAQTLI